MGKFMLTALGALGLEDEKECRENIARLEKADPYNGKLAFLRQMRVL